MSDINYKAPRKKYFDGNSKAFINFKISVWFIGAYTPYESTIYCMHQLCGQSVVRKSYFSLLNNS